jgi:hypothetical protein
MTTLRELGTVTTSTSGRLMWAILGLVLLADWPYSPPAPA